MTRAVTIFRKELKDTMRDKRTIIMLVVVPILVIPLLLGLVAKLGQSLSARAEAETSTIGFVGSEYGSALYEQFAADTLFEIRTDIDAGRIEELIRDDSLEGAVVVPPEFARRVEQDRQATVQIYFRSSNQLNVTERRMRDAIEAYDESVVGRHRNRSERRVESARSPWQDRWRFSSLYVRAVELYRCHVCRH